MAMASLPACDDVDVIAEGATVFGGKVGVDVSAYDDGAVATITNHGEISSDGFAVVGAYQSVLIDNPDTISIMGLGSSPCRCRATAASRVSNSIRRSASATTSPGAAC